MAVRSLLEVNEHLCVLVPGWVTATLRVVCQGCTTSRPTLGNSTACSSILKINNKYKGVVGLLKGTV